MRKFIWFVLIAVILFATGCNGFFGREKGVLSISLENALERSLTPDESMEPVRYQVHGEGPDGASFDESVTSETIIVEGLVFGEWTITVTGYNESESAVGSGSDTVNIDTNEETTITVPIDPLSGTGTLSLDVQWTDGDLQTPGVVASLLSVGGDTRELIFTIDGSSATFSASDVTVGYHTLSLELQDNGALAIGAVEIVRIVSDITTSGSFIFDELNQPGGSVDFIIENNLNTDLIVTISGYQAEVEENVILPLTADLTEEGVAVTYIWYVNGSSVATGSAYDFFSDQAGIYRIDVTAISADGKRGGSQTVQIKVTEAIQTEAYTIGEIGPAGGYVFYDKGEYIDGWRYLEVCPEEDYYAWSNGSNISTGLLIGDGYYNTYTLLEGNDYPAAEAARNSTYGGRTDWFLPSIDELVILTSNLPEIASGPYYWSSSSNGDSSFAFRYGGVKEEYPTNGTLGVMVVRAF